MQSLSVRLVLSAVSLLCLTPVIAGLNFKVAVVVEQNAVNISLIDLTVSRRVNSNWRLLPGHSMSHVTVQVPANAAQQAARDVCTHTDLSALLAVGSCGLASETSSLARSLQLPFVALPTAPCEPANNGYGAVGSHSVGDLLQASVAAMASKDAGQVAVLYDSAHGGLQLQNLQSSLSSIGVSSITFNAEVANQSQLGDLSEKLRQLMKKRLFNSIVMAMPHNAVNILAAAASASVMQQNYFWLIIDSGLSKAQLMTVCPINCNLALLRGGTTGVNEAGQCPAAVRDVFEECDTDHIRTLDVRLVDAIEAVAKALTNSIMQPTFQPSNASCFPLQTWTSGPDVLSNLISLSNYDSDRGVISYNSTTRRFNAQGVEIVASFTEHLSSPAKVVLSAQFSNSSLKKHFHKRDGGSFVFPNTFTGFNNATITACAPIYSRLKVIEDLGNNTYIGSGTDVELLDFLAKKLKFRYILKKPTDGQFGGPAPDSAYFTGCVGELQRGLAHIGAGPFTKTTVRDSVIDFSADLYPEYTGILVPRPNAGTKLWNVFLPLNWQVWLALIGSFFVAAFSVWVFAYFSPFSAINLTLEGAIEDEASYPEYMWTILGSFLQQGQDFYPSASSPRVALAFWWFFNIIIYSAYTAFLTSSLTVTNSVLPIKTLNDLVTQTVIKPGAVPGANAYTLLKSQQTGIYKQIADLLVDAPKCPFESLSGNIACIADLTSVEFIARQNCSSVYVAEEHFNAATVAFIYPEDAIYAGIMDFYIQKFHESGQMLTVMRKYDGSDSDTQCSIGTSFTGAESIGLDTVAGTFIVTGCFYGIGFILLIGELALVKLRKLRRG